MYLVMLASRQVVMTLQFHGSRDRITDLDASLLNEQLLLDNFLEINTKLSTRWKEYVEKKIKP